MKCPKCGGEDCHEFFNEPKEERETHFTVASVMFICVGVLAVVIAFFLFIETYSSDDEKTKILGYVMIGGVALAFISAIFGAHPHYKQVYKVKVLCKKCGYQYILEQTNIPAINYMSRKAGNVASQASGKGQSASVLSAKKQSEKNIIDENGYLRHNDVENENKK